MNKFLPIIFLFLTLCSQKLPETTQDEWIQLSKQFSELIDRDEYDSALDIANSRIRITESTTSDQWNADAYSDLGLIPLSWFVSSRTL